MLNRFYEMNGGHQHLLDIQSMRVEAWYTTAKGVKGKLVQIKKRPDLVLTVWHSPDGLTVRRGSNGEQAWERISRVGYPDEVRFLEFTPEGVFESLLVDPRASGAVLERLPDETLQRDECYVVRATLPSGHTKTYWLEKRSMREIQVKEVTAQGDESLISLEAHVKEQGIWFPGMQHQPDPQGGDSQLELVDVQINIGLLPGLFDPPADLLAKEAAARKTQ